MRSRYILLILFCYCLVFKANAQEMFPVNGVVYKKSSPDRVPKASITNLRTKSLMMTDDRGTFHILALTGDTLIFKKFDYTTQFFVITSTLDINIYLQPIVLLDEVNIKEQTKKQEINDMMGLYQKGNYYTLTPSIWSMISSPLTGMYELFGQQPNRARKFQLHTQEELEHIEVNKRYTAALIKKVTGLTDDKEIQEFKDVFTPAYIDIKTWSDYEVVKYIKTSYDWYKTHKKEVKLPTLY